MFIRDYPFRTSTVTICETHHLYTLYDGLTSDIPECLLSYFIVRTYINDVIHNTYMEVYKLC